MLCGSYLIPNSSSLFPLIENYLNGPYLKIYKPIFISEQFSYAFGNDLGLKRAGDLLEVSNYTDQFLFDLIPHGDLEKQNPSALYIEIISRSF